MNEGQTRHFQTTSNCVMTFRQTKLFLADGTKLGYQSRFLGYIRIQYSSSLSEYLI